MERNLIGFTNIPGEGNGMSIVTRPLLLIQVWLGVWPCKTSSFLLNDLKSSLSPIHYTIFRIYLHPQKRGRGKGVAARPEPYAVLKKSYLNFAC